MKGANMFRFVRVRWFAMKKYVAAFALTLVLTATARGQLVNSEWNTGNGSLRRASARKSAMLWQSESVRTVCLRRSIDRP